MERFGWLKSGVSLPKAGLLVTLALTLSLMPVSLMGCGSSSAPKIDGEEESASEAKQAALEEETEEIEQEESDEDAAVFEDVEIPTRDGIILQGKLYDPTQAIGGSDEAAADEAAPKNKFPLVVMMHQLNGSSDDFKKFPALLVKSGYAVLTFDLRGHGKSIKKKRSSTKISWRYFKDADWQKLPEDILDVMNFFEKNKSIYPQVDSGKIILVGASVSANAAILAGSKYPAFVKAVVLLSPGENYKGLKPVEAMVDFNAPIYLVASQEDTDSFKVSQLLYRIAVGKKSVRLYKNVGHGTEMLDNYAPLKKDIIKWLSKLSIHNAYDPSLTGKDQILGDPSGEGLQVPSSEDGEGAEGPHHE